MGYSYLGAKISEPVDGPDFGGCAVVFPVHLGKISGSAKFASLGSALIPPPSPAKVTFRGAVALGRFPAWRRNGREKTCWPPPAGRADPTRPKIGTQRHSFSGLSKHLRL